MFSRCEIPAGIFPLLILIQNEQRSDGFCFGFNYDHYIFEPGRYHKFDEIYFKVVEKIKLFDWGKQLLTFLGVGRNLIFDYFN